MAGSCGGSALVEMEGGGAWSGSGARQPHAVETTGEDVSGDDGGCDRTSSRMRGLSPKIISGDSL
jgi:hypothetical protein